MVFTEFFLAFGTIFPIVNPISTTFAFDSLTAKFTRRRQINAAAIASLTAFIGLFLFLLFGRYILSFFDVTVYAFRVAGGLYLGKVAFDMLGKSFYKTAQERENRDDVAIIPVGIPLLAGPGSMAAVLVLTKDQSWAGYVGIGLAIVVTCVISFGLLAASGKINKVLGRTGAKVIERVFGLIVLVIAAQFAFDGITGYLSSLGFSG